MKSIPSTITQRGQVTLPAEIRKKLNVKPKDKVVFKIADDETVHVIPGPLALEKAFGSVKPIKKPENFKKLSRQARDEKQK